MNDDVNSAPRISCSYVQVEARGNLTCRERFIFTVAAHE